MRRALPIMSRGEHGKSTRISALEELKKEEKSTTKQPLITYQRQRKRGKGFYESHKASSSHDSDKLIHTDSDELAMPTRTVMPEPEKTKLGLLLDALQRRDHRNFFAEPVDEDEVENYYEVIKKPMDFGTIAYKLHEGSYTTVGEFKDDIYLVFSNAFNFNGSNTVYYRKALDLQRDANLLFDTLENDPSNFEAECLKIGDSPTQKGKGRKKSESFEGNRRDTYMPDGGPRTEKDMLMSMVLESPQQLIQVNGGGSIDYANRLMRFAKNLGPTAQMVARMKIAPILEASKAVGGNMRN